MGLAARVYIGWDSRFPEPADVLAHSFAKRTSVSLDIRFLKYASLSEALKFNRTPDPLATTEFTFTRFLVPHLCNYEGLALFCDNDQLCLGDIGEIFALPMHDLALRVVKHDYQPTETTKMCGLPQTSYPRKNWSSMMLMNCAKLTLWTKEVVETASGAYLHRFQDIPDEQIGDLPPGWNELDRMDANTKLIHWTSGMLWNDPKWKARYGKPGATVWPHQDVWLKAYREMQRGN